MSVFTNFFAVYGTDSSTSGAANGLSGVAVAVIALLVLAFVVLMIAALWKVFVKAGKPGWAAIVPIYNSWVLAEVAGKPGWWGLYPLLGIIPFVGWIGSLVVSIMIAVYVAHNFGRTTVWGIVSLWLFGFVGYPVLGFGDAQYHPVSGGTDTPSAQPPQTPAQPTPPAAPIS